MLASALAAGCVLAAEQRLAALHGLHRGLISETIQAEPLLTKREEMSVSSPKQPTSSRLSAAQGLPRLYSSAVGRKATSQGIKKPVTAARAVATPLQARYLHLSPKTSWISVT